MCALSSPSSVPAASRRRWLMAAVAVAIVLVGLLLYEFPTCCAPTPVHVQQSAADDASDPARGSR